MPTPNTSAEKTPNKQPSRRERKQALLQTLEQQRIDIMVDSLRLNRAAAPIDATWQQLIRFKKPLYLLGGFVAWKLTRKPGRLMQLGKKAVSGYAVAKRVRQLTR
ncbi:YqjK family protein [Halomonas sp. CH40]